MNSDLKKLQQNLLMSENHVTELESINNRYKNTISELEQDNGVLKNQNKEGIDMIKNLTKKLTDVQEELDKTINDYESINTKYRNLESDLLNATNV